MAGCCSPTAHRRTWQDAAAPPHTDAHGRMLQPHRTQTHMAGCCSPAASPQGIAGGIVHNQHRIPVPMPMKVPKVPPPCSIVLPTVCTRSRPRRPYLRRTQGDTVLIVITGDALHPTETHLIRSKSMPA